MRTIALWLMASLALAASDETAAQNLVANGNFDTDSAPWMEYMGSDATPARWEAEDCCGNPASGSIMFITVLISRLHSNCMPITGGSEYDFQLMLRLSHVVPGFPGIANLTVGWFTAPDCAGLPLDSMDYPIDTMEYTTAWTWFGSRLAAPPDVTHAQLRFTTSHGLSNTTTARIDDVRFGPAGSVPVGLVSFTVD